jgi:hypothetical protein
MLSSYGEHQSQAFGTERLQRQVLVRLTGGMPKITIPKWTCADTVKARIETINVRPPGPHRLRSHAP